LFCLAHCDRQVTDGEAALVAAVAEATRKTLTQVFLDNNELTRAGLELLLPALARVKCLSLLHLHCNELDDDAARGLAGETRCSAAVYRSFSPVRMPCHAMPVPTRTPAGAAPAFRMLERLAVDGNPVTASGVCVLVAALAPLPKLRAIYLPTPFNSVGEAEVRDTFAGAGGSAEATLSFE
jgi:hypothetical protein